MNKTIIAVLTAFLIGMTGFAIYKDYEGSFDFSGGGVQVRMEGKPTTKN